MTIKLEFSQEEREKIAYERYHYPDPKVQRRLDALHLKGHGLSHKEIQKICGIQSRTTLSKYFKIYEAEGVEGLKRFEYQGRTNELLEQGPTLAALFEATPPHTSAQAQAMIEAATGVRRSPTQVRTFLHRLGLRYRKVGQVPGKAMDPEQQEKQAQFQREELESRYAEAQAGERILLFMDAAHFVYGAFLGALWCVTRLFIETPSGRKRFNVLGAVDALSKQILTFTNESYINSQSVCTFLDQIRQHYGDAIPITIVLDNAAYQRCWLVRHYAASLNIELLFLPPYSPHLNLIERLWRLTKKECLYSQYYTSFADFRYAIASFLDNAHISHKEQLGSLLSFNFQSFDNVHFLSV